MPRDFIYKSAITIDHTANVMLVDTTVPLPPKGRGYLA